MQPLNLSNTVKYHRNQIADCQFHSLFDFNSDEETIRKLKKSWEQGLLTVIQNGQRNCKEYGVSMPEQRTK